MSKYRYHSGGGCGFAAGGGGGFVGRSDGGAGYAGGGVGKGSEVLCAATACIDATVSGTDAGSTTCVRSWRGASKLNVAADIASIKIMASLCDSDLAVSGENGTPQDA